MDTSGREQRWRNRGAVAATIGIAVTLVVIPIAWVHATNDRVLVGYHGFVHSAIVETILRSGVSPENPFLAGHELTYYWFFHVCAAAVRALTDTDALHALEAVVLGSLVLLVATAVCLGHRAYQSLWRGVLLALIALVGGNAFGLVIALVRWAAGDGAFFDETPERVTSTYRELSQYGHRLYGPNYLYFFYNTSRGVALAGLLLTVGALFRAQRSPSFVAGLGVVAASALTTAMSPIIGIAAVGALCGALLVRDGRAWASRGGNRSWQSALCLGVGVVVALPTYFTLLRVPESGYAFVLFSAEGWKLAMSVAVGAGPLLVLALRRGRLGDASGPDGRFLDTLVIAGATLLLAAVCFRLPYGNSCHFYLAGVTLLALPAAGVRGLRGSARTTTAAGVAIALLLASNVPFLIRAHTHRAPLGLAIVDGRLNRGDSWPDIARAYAWIDANTEHDAVVVSNPQHEMALSGNVPELPAMARRPLFIGKWFYLTGPFRDAVMRTRQQIAIQVASGRPLDEAARTEFSALARPIYVISHRAGPTNALEAVHGRPVFRSGRVAIFRLREFGD